MLVVTKKAPLQRGFFCGSITRSGGQYGAFPLGAIARLISA